MHLRESRTSKFSGLRQIYPPVTLKYPLVQKLIETPVISHFPWIKCYTCEPITRPHHPHLCPNFRLASSTLPAPFNHSQQHLCSVPISLFCSHGLNEFLEICLKFPFNLIGKLAMEFLTGQSRFVLKSWCTGWDLEQGF